MIQHWPDGVDVLFNPAHNTLPEGVMEAGIKYACWSIKERTGIDIRYAGQTTELRVSGKITVMTALPKDYPEYGLPYQLYVHGFASRSYWPDKPYDSSVVGIFQHWLGIGKLSRRNQCTIGHELLHSCGAAHLTHERAIMRAPYSGLDPECYGLVCADFGPLVREGGNQSFVELTMEYDLCIPRIQGKTADLEYVGDGTTHRWRMRRLSDAGEGIESAATVADLRNPDIVMTDVRSPTIRLTRVELKYEPETETWLLVYAE